MLPGVVGKELLVLLSVGGTEDSKDYLPLRTSQSLSVDCSQIV